MRVKLTSLCPSKYPGCCLLGNLWAYDQIELGHDACLDVTWYTRAIIGGPISLAAIFLLATILWEALGSLMYLHWIYCHYSLPTKVTLLL